MHSDPLTLDHSSPKVFTSKCPLIFLHLFLLLLSRVSNQIAFTVNLFLYLPFSTWFRAVPEPNLILKHSIVPIAFQSFPQMWKSCPYPKHINIRQHYKLATTIFWYRSTLILECNCLFTFALLNAVPSHEKWGHCLGLEVITAFRFIEFRSH